MKLSHFKTYLENAQEVNFELPGGDRVQPHAHLTELGMVSKTYLDCGGNRREEKYITMQLWEADDVDHRLTPGKLRSIISTTERDLGLEDLPIRVEYQTDTLGMYELAGTRTGLKLKTVHTLCQASDHCGIPVKKKRLELNELQAETDSCCVPGSGCC